MINLYIALKDDNNNININKVILFICCNKLNSFV